MTDWDELEIDFGCERIRFFRDRPPADYAWRTAENWASDVLDRSIAGREGKAFLVFSENETEKLKYLKEWIGRKYRYYLWGGLLRVFLICRMDGRARILMVKGKDPLGNLSDGEYHPLCGGAFVNGTAIFPAYYVQAETGEEKQISVMLRVSVPDGEKFGPQADTENRNMVPIMSGGQEIAQGYFARRERMIPAGHQLSDADFSRWRCELIC